MWSEIAEELNLSAIDDKHWFESQRTRNGKLYKQQSGQAPRELTRRLERCQQKFGVRHKCHKQHEESRGLTADGDNLESSVRTSQTALPLQSSTPVSTDSSIIEHFEQMRTLISGFLQQKSTSDRQPFYDYVDSEADNMNMKISRFLSSMLSRM